jgi:hypothetical protein
MIRKKWRCATLLSEELSVCYSLFHAAYDSALAINSRPAGIALSGIKSLSFPAGLTNAEAQIAVTQVAEFFGESYE